MVGKKGVTESDGFWKIALTVMRMDWTGGLEVIAAVLEEVMLAGTRAETVVGRAKR